VLVVETAWLERRGVNDSALKVLFTTNLLDVTCFSSFITVIFLSWQSK
jgi:hypothetical protein